MIYVASSWRNPLQIAVVAALRSAARMTGNSALEPYDFRHPAHGNAGFHWSEVMLTYVRGSEALVDSTLYRVALEHSRAQEGFKFDHEAMKVCDTCVLVLPCGRSAHLEAGWFIGKGKRTAILLDNPVQPELMYLLADYIAESLWDLLGWLGVPD